MRNLLSLLKSFSHLGDTLKLSSFFLMIFTRGFLQISTNSNKLINNNALSVSEYKIWAIMMNRECVMLGKTSLMNSGFIISKLTLLLYILASIIYPSSAIIEPSTYSTECCASASHIECPLFTVIFAIFSWGIK